MRLIDADALKAAAHKEWDECLVWDESGETTADEFCDLVESLPTIDAVPVVRCKDCVYWRHDDCQNDNHGFCPINENDFCSWGSERKGANNERTD